MNAEADVKGGWKIGWAGLAPGLWFGLLGGGCYGWLTRNPLADSPLPLNWAAISPYAWAPYLLNPDYESYIWSMIPLSALGLLYRLPASRLEQATAARTGLFGASLRAAGKGLLAGLTGMLAFALAASLGAPSPDRAWTLFYKEVYWFFFALRRAGMVYLWVLAALFGAYSLFFELKLKPLIEGNRRLSRFLSKVKTFGL